MGSGRAHVAPGAMVMIRCRRRNEVPCTRRRSPWSRARRDERLGPGRSAAPDEVRLVLLPSGPDTVRESPLRGTRSSTSLEAVAFEYGDLGWEFSPAGADCRFRAPLVPRLARPRKDTPVRRWPAREWALPSAHRAGAPAKAAGRTEASALTLRGPRRRRASHRSEDRC